MQRSEIYRELGMLASSGADAGAAPESGRHAYHAHVHLWDYCRPELATPFAASPETRVFDSPPAGYALEQAMAATRLLVFVGARHSPELERAMNRPGGVCLVFEPSRERLEAFLAAHKPRELANRGLFFVSGDPDRLDVPLLSMLPESVCDAGYPLVFASEGLPEALPGYLARVEQLTELFYYRNVLYSLESQENIRGLPLRPMVSDYVWDRLKHVYENLEACLRGGLLSDLLGGLVGHTAILCAAGPALAQSLDYIAANRDRAAVIAVNSAVKPLLRAGIRPHFVVINDTSVDSEPTLRDLPPMEDAILVPHCLSFTGDGAFARPRFFGNFPGQPFPHRPSLLLHGSVITTAFSLAEYLGCTQAVLAGVQLASPDPYHLNYAAGSQHEGQDSGVRHIEHAHRWPELYPVQAADGGRMYTTLNFFDAAQWFADRISQASLRVVNLCPSSILTGPGIAFDPCPALPPVAGLDERIRALPCSDFSGRKQRVLDYIRQEMARWKTKQLQAREAGGSFRLARAFIERSDADNTSFMLQRYKDFSNACFHAGYFEAQDEAERARHASYFLHYAQDMCATFLRILNRQHRVIAAGD